MNNLRLVGIAVTVLVELMFATDSYAQRVFDQTRLPSECPGLPSVHYINGIDTTDFSAYRQSLAVRDVVVEAIETPENEECVIEGKFLPAHDRASFPLESDSDLIDRDPAFNRQFETVEGTLKFNTSGSFAYDAIQTIAQLTNLPNHKYSIIAEDLVDYFVGGLNIRVETRPFVREAVRVALATSASLAEDTVRPDDFDILKAEIRKSTELGSVLIIGYSQGSVYGAFAKEDLLDEGVPAEKIQTLWIGTPLPGSYATIGEVSLWPYITSKKDRLIGSMSAVGLSASPNTNNAPCGDGPRRSHHFHGLESDYLGCWYGVSKRSLPQRIGDALGRREIDLDPQDRWVEGETPITRKAIDKAICRAVRNVAGDFKVKCNVQPFGPSS